MPNQTMTGPALLRDWAEKIENWNWRPGQLLGPVALRQMAGGWEADLNYSAGLIADATLRAERAEAALEQARALAEELAAMRYKDDVTRDDYREYADKLAALLAAAPGGAELDAALSDLTMRPRAGAGGGDAE